MKAVYIESLGPPNVLKLGERPDPTINPGEILIDIHAASINAADAKVRAGKIPNPTMTFPYILGRDFSGVVCDVAADVTDFEIGDAVFGVCDVGQEGTYCEKVAMKASLCAKKPDGVRHVDICALALTGLTALTSLEDTLKVKKGEKVFIQGGAGGVGGVAVEIAKYLGAYVITTTSTPNVEYVESLGPDEVIDYRERDFRKEASDCDVVFDTVGGDVALQSFDVLKKGGRAAFIASGRIAPEPPSDDVTSLRPNVIRDRSHLERVSELLEMKAIKIPCIKLFSLEDAVEAHTISDSRHFRGKLVFKIRD